MTTITDAAVILWRCGPLRCAWTPGDGRLTVLADTVTVFDETYDLLELISRRSADLERVVHGLSWAELADLIRGARVRQCSG